MCVLCCVCVMREQSTARWAVECTPPRSNPLSPCVLPPAPLPPCLHKRAQEVKLEDLKHVAALGSGAFGRVTLVQVGGQWPGPEPAGSGHAAC